MKEKDKIQAALDQAAEWLDTAKAAYDDPDTGRAVASALISLTYANMAIVDYIRKRDAAPSNEHKHLLDLGIELGKQLSKEEDTPGEPK